MGYPDTFSGFCVDSPKTCKEFKKQELIPKPFEDHDVDVQIECCGVCGSDIHTLTGGWGDFKGPLCVGHEVVGKAVRVGKGVTLIKEGDRVGVGAEVWACLKCDVCKSKNENYCPHWVGKSSPVTVELPTDCSLTHFQTHTTQATQTAAKPTAAGPTTSARTSTSSSRSPTRCPRTKPRPCSAPA
jgi:Zn-dependent alcohol dehydrogenase